MKITTPSEHLSLLKKQYEEKTREASVIRMKIDDIERELAVPYKQFIRSAK